MPISWILAAGLNSVKNAGWREEIIVRHHDDDTEEALYADSEAETWVPPQNCRICKHRLNTRNHRIGMCFVCQKKYGYANDGYNDDHDEEEDDDLYPENVLFAVCTEYGISRAVLHDSWGHRNAIEARQVAAWILNYHSKLLKQDIARIIHTGNNVGSGTNYACKRIEQQMEKDPSLAARIRKILETCGLPPEAIA